MRDAADEEWVVGQSEGDSTWWYGTVGLKEATNRDDRYMIFSMDGVHESSHVL